MNCGEQKISFGNEHVPHIISHTHIKDKRENVSPCWCLWEIAMGRQQLIKVNGVKCRRIFVSDTISSFGLCDGR
jgi:hypothetical protein